MYITLYLPNPLSGCKYNYSVIKIITWRNSFKIMQRMMQRMITLHHEKQNVVSPLQAAM